MWKWLTALTPQGELQRKLARAEAEVAVLTKQNLDKWEQIKQHELAAMRVDDAININRAVKYLTDTTDTLVATHKELRRALPEELTCAIHRALAACDRTVNEIAQLRTDARKAVEQFAAGVDENMAHQLTVTTDRIDDLGQRLRAIEKSQDLTKQLLIVIGNRTKCKHDAELAVVKKKPARKKSTRRAR